MTYSSENKVDGIVLVTEDVQEYLNPRQEVTYREHRRELCEWMLALGKNPDKATGYSHSTSCCYITASGSKCCTSQILLEKVVNN